ncbi:hypothetical protein M8818_006325 [Zalaria obscura]|uniref:Uncharacterized protein n=1 Tax=Zalaria obscura TaxID=2024903 RepID=A0ACC3S5F3_9PEZI
MSLYSNPLLTYLLEERHGHLWHEGPDHFLNSTPLDIIRHHLTKETDSNQNYLVIADRSDLEGQGLLVINLNFHGHIDALREKVYKTSDFVPSLDINHVSWVDSLRKAERPLFPRKSIALFAAVDLHPRMMMRKIHDTMNGGLDGRREGMGSIMADWESASSENFDEVVQQWRSNAREREWWNGAIVLVTQESWKEGEVVVVIETPESGHKVEKVQVKAGLAGELLLWLYVGLITAKEARSENGLDDLLNLLD